MYSQMRNYRNYEVWTKSHELTLFVYKEMLPLLPKSEQYDLLSQMKRAAYSIPMNIAEGCGRNTDKDFVHFLDQAMGSLHELEYIGLLSYELKYFEEKIYQLFQQKLEEVKAKLINLIKSIRKQ
jgi:four helix bundle protein